MKLEDKENHLPWVWFESEVAPQVQNLIAGFPDGCAILDISGNIGK